MSVGEPGRSHCKPQNVRQDRSQRCLQWMTFYADCFRGVDATVGRFHIQWTRSYRHWLSKDRSFESLNLECHFRDARVQAHCHSFQETPPLLYVYTLACWAKNISDSPLYISSFLASYLLYINPFFLLLSNPTSKNHNALHHQHRLSRHPPAASLHIICCTYGGPPDQS